MVTEMQTDSVEGQRLQNDILNILQGDIPVAPRVAAVMHHISHYVSVIDQELHTRFVEQVLGVCADFERQSNTLRQDVSFCARPLLHMGSFIFLLQMFTL